MKLQNGLVLSSLLSLGLLSYACANGDTVNNGSSGNGGSNNNTGGSSSGNSGGSQGSGNTTGNSGGSQGSGNTTGSGGVHGSGGSTGLGNTTGNSGGSTGVGNTTTGGSRAATPPVAPAARPEPAEHGGNVWEQLRGRLQWLGHTAGRRGSCWSGYAYDGGDASSTIMPR